MSDRERVWAISVDGAEPLVIGGVDSSPARLLADAMNTMELSDRALRRGFVWNAGARPVQSRTIPVDDFRQIHSGDTAKPGDSGHLMAVACQKLEQEVRHQV
ncbi:MAG: hypothetical protein F4Y28_09435 [Acidimicrobiia bacterium]|nr:hypothetical protein [Acidimicrobiia bacterium]MYG59394.1 hypothetical protein [Acidimicrobiia bacterium]MYJ32688.1 hypothetical protein [Acidimicrobiia bacterium]